MSDRSSQSRIFLEALFAEMPDGVYILIWVFPGKLSRWFRTVEEAALYIESLKKCNVYVGVGLSPANFGEYSRCKSHAVAAITGFGADIDLHSDAHPKGTRPATIEQALSIIPPEFRPSTIIETGNGVQCWWFFKEPWVFESDDECRYASKLSVRWQTALQYAAQKNGWVFERLADLARILRVPGTQNVKDAANPKDVIIRQITDRRYNPSEFQNYLDDLAIPDEDEKARQANEWQERFNDNVLTIDLVAAVPDDRLARWMEQERFPKTWKHQRTDLQDASQSGYDLALANFGVRNGLDDQEIVNLIVHNRRIHGARQRKDADYFRRAISKARKGHDGTPFGSFAPSTPPLGTENGTTAQEATTTAADPNAKAKLCEQISIALGVTIVRIVKVTGSDPLYLMELDTGGITFPDTGKLLSQPFVKSMLAGRAGKVIRKFKPKEWDQLTQMMIDACIEQAGTDDLELKGLGRMYINEYLSNHIPLPSVEQLTQSDLYGPAIDKGRIVISSTHLQDNVNRRTGQALSVKYFAAMITALGGKSVRVRRQSFKEQSRWALPIEEWDPKDYLARDGETPTGA